MDIFNFDIKKSKRKNNNIFFSRDFKLRHVCYLYFYARPKFSCAGWYLTRGVYISFELGNNLLPPSHKCLPQFINDNFARNWKFSILYVFLPYFLLSFPFMAFFTF